MTDQGSHVVEPVFGALQPPVVPHHPLVVRKAATRTAMLGIIHSALYLISFLLVRWKLPAVDATDQELASYYADGDKRRIVIAIGLYLIPFTGIAFIWFSVALRMWVSASAPRENVLLSNVQLVSGIIYTALLFVAGASLSVMAAMVELSHTQIDATVARQFPRYASLIVLVFAMRMAAMFILATSNIGRTTGILPRWFAFLGFAMAAALLLSASLSTWLITAFPAWILAFCAILLHRARKIPRDFVVMETDQAAARLAEHPVR
jgi:hypothetical protein